MPKTTAQLIVLLAIAFFAQGLAKATEREISWTDDYEGAMQRAASANSIVLLHFYGDNCPPCKLLDKKTFHDPALVSTMNEHLVAVKINANRRDDLAHKYKVTRWPTDVYLFSNGDEIYRGVSNTDPAVYCKTIERVALRHRDWSVERNAIAKAKEKRQDKSLAARTPQRQTQPSSYIGNTGHPVKTQATSWANAYNPASSHAFTGNTASPAPSTPIPANVRVIENPYIAQQPLIVPPAPDLPNPNNLPPIDRTEQTPPSPFLAPQAPQTSQTIATPQASAPNVASRSVAAQPISALLVSNQPSTPAVNIVPQNDLTSPSRVYAETVGMEGYCPVTLIESLGKPDSIGWIPGRQSSAVRHRGRIYYCATERARQLLLSDPDRYTPALSGFDIVHFCKNAKLKDGKCEFGCIQEGTNRIFLFDSKANYDEFTKDCKYYAGLIDNAGPERVASELNGTQTR